MSEITNADEARAALAQAREEFRERLESAQSRVRGHAILNGAQLEFCRSWPNQTEVTVPGIHFVQEDSPHEIGDGRRFTIGTAESEAASARTA